MAKMVEFSMGQFAGNGTQANAGEPSPLLGGQSRIGLERLQRKP